MTEPVRLTFLGGLGEIGRNCTAFEQAGRILVVDAGVMFPPEARDDFLVPEMSWLADRAEAVEGVVLTHGHLDHIGALPDLVAAVGATPEHRLPVYGAPFTLALAEARLHEVRRADRNVELIPVADRSRRRMGPFKVEVLAAAHSIPHACALAIRTDQGLIVHSGDFKLDPDPLDGRHTDLERLGELAGGDGVRLLLSDSTNAMEDGCSGGEAAIGAEITRLVAGWAGRRVIVSCFASNVHRVASLILAAEANGRHVALVGRSLLNTVQAAKRCGLIDPPPLVDARDVDSCPDGEILVICTGAQGEGRSVLARMSTGDPKLPEVGSGDVVVLSSSVIPGNEESVATMVRRLVARGAQVVGDESEHVHVSGHANRDELAQMLRVVRPRQFVPVHGTDEHLLAHAGIGLAGGIAESDIRLAARLETVVLGRGREMDVEGSGRVAQRVA